MTFKVAYTPKFKQFIRQNPELVRQFLKTYKDGLEKTDDDGLIVRKIKTDGGIHKGAWQVEAGNRNFFVKEIPCSPLNERSLQQGYEQFMALRRLSKIKFRHVRPLEPHFGLNDGATSFLVLDFVPLEERSGITKDIPASLRLEFRLFRFIAKMFFGIKDLDKNHFYNQKDGSIMVFDPRKSAGLLPKAYAAFFGAFIRKGDATDAPAS